jgi:hypothetical protein
MTSLVQTLSKSTTLIRTAFLASLGLAIGAQNMMAQANEVDFDLTANPKTVACLGVPGGPTPTAHVTVKRGTLSDTLTIVGDNIRPTLAFDMFTVQRSNLKANGTVDTTVKNFGLAWYQSDLRANAAGHFQASIKTILLDRSSDSIRIRAIRPQSTPFTLDSGSTIRRTRQLVVLTSPSRHRLMVNTTPARSQ